MTDWTASDLDTLDRIPEIRVAGRRDDGTLRTPVIVWQVVVGGALYLRSVHGEAGRWYQGVAERMEGAILWDDQRRDVRFIRDDQHDPAVDDAYFAKYGRGSSAQAITTAVAAATTLRVEPVA